MAWEKLDNIRGPKGEKGDTGTVASASVATLPPDAAATVTITGGTEAHMHLEVPRGARGERGPAGAVASASAESVPAEQQAAVIMSGTEEVKHLHIEVPRGLPGVEAVPSAEAVGTYLAAGDSPAQPGFDQGSANLVGQEESAFGAAVRGLITDIADPAGMQAKIFAIRFNVKDFGAVGDGVADDTAAVQAAIDAVGLFGGAIYFPPGLYYLHGYARLRSNITIYGDGATIIKRAGRTSYACFAALSGKAQGYGASVENVTMHGLEFRGNFTPGQVAGLCALALHHARNVLVYDCVFEEAQVGGHIIDAGGCDGVTVRGCTFRGFRAEGQILHTECIQADVSSAGGVSVEDDPAGFDALPSINMTVEGNTFEPLTIGAVTYPAPVPFGSHSASDGKPYTGMVFRGNRVLSHVGNLSSGHAGSVHFVAVDGLIVEGNTFENPDGHKAIAVGLRVVTSGVNAGNAATGGESITPMGCHNVTIRGNSFTGFDSADVTYPVVFMQDSTFIVEKRNISVVANIYQSSAAGGGQAFCRVQNVRRFGFSQNIVNGAMRAVQVSRSKDLAFDGNVIDGAGAQAMFINDVDGASFSGNTVSGFHGPAIQADTVTSLSISGGALREHHAGDNAIRLNNCPGFSVSGVVAASASAHRPVAAVSVSGATSTGVAVGNASRGYTDAVVVGPGATVEMAANLKQ